MNSVVLLMTVVTRTLPLTTMDDIMGDLLQTVIDAIKSVISAFASMVTAIPEAVATIFSQWAYIVGNTWYGPILGAITIAIVLLIGYGVLWIIERFLF